MRRESGKELGRALILKCSERETRIVDPAADPDTFPGFLYERENAWHDLFLASKEILFPDSRICASEKLGAWMRVSWKNLDVWATSTFLVSFVSRLLPTAAKQMKWVLLGIIMSVMLLVAVFLVVLVIIHAAAQAIQEILVARWKDVESSLQTGDLVLFKHEKYDMPWLLGIDRIMSHMGVVWRHPEQGVLIVDMNPTRTGPFPDPLPFEPVLHGPSIMVSRMSDVVTFYPGSVFIRPLRTSLTQDAESRFLHKLLTWAMHLHYDDSISKRDWITWLALAISPVFPDLGDALVTLTPLTHTRTSSFCTEMISELFQAAGVISKRHVSHIWGPVAWQYGIGAGAGDRDRLWDREIQLIM